MPYRKLQDLPPRVKGSLPAKAQAIYLRAFNNAWEEYRSAAKRRTGSDREETAHKIAWSAVKRQYVRIEPGAWRHK
jgi:cation transport regulator